MADSRFMPKYRQKNNLRHVIASEVKRLGEKIRTSGLLNPIQIAASVYYAFAAIFFDIHAIYSPFSAYTYVHT